VVCRFVEHGKNGYLASNLEEWVNALTCLRNDKALCSRLGMSGRKKVETCYCVQVIAPRLVELFRQSMPSRAGKISLMSIFLNDPHCRTIHN